jgi:hypothetical protein
MTADYAAREWQFKERTMSKGVAAGSGNGETGRMT